MRRVPVLHLFVIALILLAGCNSFGLADDSSQPDTSTVTPVPVPTDKPTSTPVPQLAPGLERNDLNVDALVSAHNATLRNTSFTRKIVRTARFPNGTLYSQSSVVYHVEDDGNISYSGNLTIPQTEYEGVANATELTHYEGWISEKYGVIKSTYTNNTTTYTESSPQQTPSGLSSYAVGANSIRRLFTGTETRVTDSVSRNGTTFYQVDSTVIRMAMASPPGASLGRSKLSFKNLSQAYQQALISSSGVVYRYRTEYNVTSGNETFNILIESQYANISSTTVERPSWYGKAVNTSDTQRTTRTEQGTTLISFANPSRD